MSEDNAQIGIKVIVPTKSNEKSEISCDVCYRVFRIEKDLTEHICINDEKYPDTCEKCGKHFQSKKSLKIHARKYHAPEKYICQEQGCGKRFKHEINLKQHYVAHVKYKPFRCKLCGKTFKLPSHLKRHSYVHQTDATFVKASEVRTLKDSDSDDSSEEDSEEEALPEKLVRVFTCEICNKHFKRNGNLKLHLNSAAHTTKVFRCAACEPELHFDSVSARQDHYDTVHSGKPFICKVCDKSFKQLGNLKKHKCDASN